ncbi:MAG: hypothetical protein K0R02_1038 [Rickettsiaceae bacterium]|jgi:hypothetical protein|nr:hypothetical protein [Rickettsiaceae bacterium]
MAIQTKYNNLFREYVREYLEDMVNDAINGVKEGGVDYTKLSQQYIDTFISVLLSNLIRFDTDLFKAFLNIAPITSDMKVFLCSLHDSLHEQKDKNAIFTNEKEQGITDNVHEEAVRGFVTVVIEEEKAKLLVSRDLNQYVKDVTEIHIELSKMDNDDSWQNSANSHKALNRDASIEANQGFIDGLNEAELNAIRQYEMQQLGYRGENEAQAYNRNNIDVARKNAQIQQAIELSLQNALESAQKNALAADEIIDPDLAQAIALSLQDNALAADEIIDPDLTEDEILDPDISKAVEFSLQQINPKQIRMIHYQEEMADLEQLSTQLSNEEYNEYLSGIMTRYADLHLGN